MIHNRMKIKSLAFAFLCLYACCYPIFALLFLNQNSENVGSLALQAFQGATVFALFPFWKYHFSLRSFNVWFVGIIYFASVSVFMAVFRAFDEKTVEVTFALRFIFWMIFAFFLDSDGFSPDKIKQVVYCFAIGAAIQCFIAIACYAFNLGGGSIYSDINASAGSKYVSGKTIVSFVSLEIILAFYWFIKSKKRRVCYLFLLLLGVLVLLFSYNRAGQLALVMASCWIWYWSVRRRRWKILASAFAGLVVLLVFLVSSYGEVFLERWRQIGQDQGSGRFEIFTVVWNNLVEPKSPGALFFGRGYHKTKNLMEGNFGIRIGTHSDVMDFSTSYGLIGLAFYIAIIWKFFSYRKIIPLNSLARLCSVASTVAFVVISVVTGVFQGTFAVLMFLFLLRYYQNEGIPARTVREGLVYEGVPVPQSDRNGEFDVQFDEFQTFEDFEGRDLLAQEPNDAFEEKEFELSEQRTNDSKRLGVDNEDESAVETDDDETNRQIANEVVNASEEITNDVDEYDEETRSWLNGLDSIFGDVGEVTQLFPQGADQKIEHKEIKRG